MSKRSGAVLFFLFSLTFLVVNRGAYVGFFENDDLSTLGWTRGLELSEYARLLVSPLYQANNFRPVGHSYYRVCEHFLGLDFAKYVAVAHMVHLINVWLLWLLVRRLGAKPWQAAVSCAFFGLHMALFETFWKPMYIFDALCGSFCLLSLLAYSRQRWILSFAAFWLAYKSKELAVMLPVALAAYEYWFGKRRWRQLAPFFLVSLSFGVQGLLPNASRETYKFQFTAGALLSTVTFYAGRVFLLPYAGLVLPLAALVWKNRRVWFGLLILVAFAFPLFFLPGRLHGAYCYVPFIGLAVAFAGITESVRPLPVAMFLLLWAPVEYRWLRRNASAAREAQAQVRAWVSGLEASSKAAPFIDAVVYAAAPGGLDSYGVEGATRYFWRRTDIAVREIDANDDKAVTAAFAHGRTALLSWDAERRKLDVLVHSPEEQPAPYISMTPATPIWQLEKGWYSREGAYRWIAPHATAQLTAPASARRFELRANIGRELIQSAGPVSVRVALNGRSLDPRRFAEAGWQEAQWDVTPQPGRVRVEFFVEPGFRPPHDTRVLGLAIGAFGFRD